jgi:cellulose synthase/poly-beta-1,6-N-acetylglucosamine synthase-like glycosyltransferase
MSAALSVTLDWVLWGLYALVVLKWLAGHLEINRNVKALSLSPAPPTSSPTPTAGISVIIAAHNEADSITACLARVCAQDHPVAQVIVANDRSTDGTAQAISVFARRHPEVQYLDIAALPSGWLGKAHALAQAADRADGDWLVFTDADVVWHPALLRTIMELSARERLDFVSLWPNTVVIGFWERLLIPACGWALGLWFAARCPGVIAETPAFANGQFIAIRREAYARIGGFAAVRDDLTEDVALARRAKAAGLRRYMGLGRELLNTRMYENLSQVISGWTRIFTGALRTRRRLAATLLATTIGCWSAFAAMLVLALRPTAAGWGPLESAWLIAALAHLAAMYSVLRRQMALGLEGRPLLTLFPLALIGVVLLLCRCLLLTSGLGTVSWGGIRFKVRGTRAVAPVGSG